MNRIAWEQLWPDLRSLSERTMIGLLIIAAFWLGGRILSRLIFGTRHSMPHNTGLLNLRGQASRIAMIVFGVATALGAMGINVSALVAGLGLTGFALGFALRDVLSNLISGVLLLLFRPFGAGDRISVTGLEGEVQTIDLRYTIIRQSDGIALIPNANMFTNPILVERQEPSSQTSEPASHIVRPFVS